MYICIGGKLEEAEDFKCIFVVYFQIELWPDLTGGCGS